MPPTTTSQMESALSTPTARESPSTNASVEAARGVDNGVGSKGWEVGVLDTTGDWYNTGVNVAGDVAATVGRAVAPGARVSVAVADDAPGSDTRGVGVNVGIPVRCVGVNVGVAVRCVVHAPVTLSVMTKFSVLSSRYFTLSVWISLAQGQKVRAPSPETPTLSK
jgi:hypothetical protein